MCRCSTGECLETWASETSAPSRRSFFEHRLRINCSKAPSVDDQSQNPDLVFLSFPLFWDLGAA